MPAAPDEGLGRAKHYMKRFKSKRRTVTYAREATGRNPADFHPAPPLPWAPGARAHGHQGTTAERWGPHHDHATRYGLLVRQTDRPHLTRRATLAGSGVAPV